MNEDRATKRKRVTLYLLKKTIFPVLFVDIYLYLISAMLLAVTTVFYHVIDGSLLLKQTTSKGAWPTMKKYTFARDISWVSLVVCVQNVMWNTCFFVETSSFFFIKRNASVEKIRIYRKTIMIVYHSVLFYTSNACFLFFF